MTSVVGTCIPERHFTIDRARLIRYAGASGDFNRIHWDAAAARAAGLPNVLAHGMLSMALAGRVLTDWLVDPGRIKEFRVRFAAPLPVAADVDTTVCCGGEVTEVRDDRTAVVTLYLRHGGADILTRVEAIVELPA